MTTSTSVTREARPQTWPRAIIRLVGSALWRWVVVLVVMVGLGYLVTRVADHVWPLTVEDHVNEFFADRRTPTWNEVTVFTSGLGNTTTIVPLCVVAVAVLRLWLGRWREAIFVALCAIGQSVVFLFTTLLIDRERPDVPHLDQSPPTSSFPSGHTGASLALYVALAIVVLRCVRPIWARWGLATLLVLLPVAVGVGRLYRGMHHPSDLVGSAVNATLIITLTYYLVFRATLPEEPAGERATG
jgi:membrane-associated phospholipid phosphatase